MRQNTFIKSEDNIYTAVTNREFVPPETIDEAEERLKKITEQAADIDYQLGDPSKRDAEGNVMPYEVYREWRRRALSAKRFRERQITKLREWIKQYRQNEIELLRQKKAQREVERSAQRAARIQQTEILSSVSDPKDPIQVLRAVTKLCKAICVENGIELYRNPERQALLNLAEYLLGIR